MEPDPEALTEQEAAVYDRQIRVWGVDAQRRLSKSRILVFGMTGVIAEMCKNIVLAGIGSLTLMDDRSAGLEVSAAQFLIPAGLEESDKDSLLTICMKSLKDFNPMVHVSVEAGNLMDKPPEFLDAFDAVVLGRSPLSFRKKINALCRKRPHRVAFYTVDCRGGLGEMFVDLQRHSYTQTKGSDKDSPLLQDLQFCSLEEAMSVRWESLPKKTTKLFFAMRTIEEFEEANGRIPGHISPEDSLALLAIRNKLCEAQGVSESLISEKLLQKLLRAGSGELSPVCAIVGGIIGQEVLKAMSSKGEPLKNFFFFDASDGKGIIENIFK